MNNIKTYSLIITLLIISKFYSQIEGITTGNPNFDVINEQKEGINIAPNSTLTIPNILPSTNLLKNKITSEKLYLKLDLGEDLVTNINFDYEVDLILTYQLIGGTSSFLPISKNIQISSTFPEKLEIIDLTNQLEDYTDILITIISKTTNPNPLTPLLLKNIIDNKLRLKTTFVREFKTDVRLDSNNELAPPITLGVVTPNNKRHTFNWLTNGYNYPNYEIQILKVINENPDNTNPLIVSNATIDWNKALKIETQSFHTDLSLIISEGTGWYTWRVRPIGNYYEGGIGNSNNHGRWSLSYLQGTTKSFSGTTAYSFYYTDPDDQKNWNYTRVFTEGDQSGERGVRTSEAITYADGLLRTRQSQQYNSDNQTTIVSQTISDYSGRPALTTIPVPVVGDLNGYKENFVQNSTGTIYTAKDYDTDTNFKSPSKIKDTGTSFTYYNGTNTDGVASAEGFAFSRTLFKTDGTGRTTESSGIGKKHSIGDRALGRGRTTKILYSSPSDAELIRIFGDEAPLAESVIKTITIDPNDVISLAYTSKEGKTIATALISDSTNNLLELNGGNNNFTITNTTNQNILSFNKFVSSKRIAIIADQTEVTLGYKLTELNTPCGFGCQYGVRFYLSNLTNNETFKSETYPISNVGDLIFSASNPLIFTGINTQNDIISTTGKFNLNIGEYLITKEVFSMNSTSNIEEILMTRADKIESILLAITDKMDSINNGNDLIDFEVIMADIQTHFENLWNNPSSTSDQTAIQTILNLPQDFEFPPFFKVAYSSSNGLEIIDYGINNIPPNSAGVSGCEGCGSNSIPIPKPEICKVCEGDNITDQNGTPLRSIETIRSTATSPIIYTANNSNQDWEDIKVLVDQYFIQYLLDKLNEQTLVELSPSQIQDKLTKIAPGFTTESLSYMLTNMLASKYYTGKRKEDSITPGIWYRAEENNNMELEFIDLNGNLSSSLNYSGQPLLTSYTSDLEYNYECKALFNCWTQAVDMIGAFEFEDSSVDIMDSFDKNQGHDTGDNGDSPSNQHVDNDESKEGGQGGNILLDWIISRKMRKFDGKNFSKPELETFVSLPNLFLECAGHSFLAIIDDQSIINNDIPSDYITITPQTANVTIQNTITDSVFTSLGGSPPKMMNFDSNTPELEIFCEGLDNQGSHEKLNYPYIVKPEWMFKYFVYNIDNNLNQLSSSLKIPDNNQLIVTQQAIEISSNYNNFADCGSPCFEKPDYNHKNWSKGQLLNFYQKIRGGKQSATECTYPNEPTPPTPPSLHLAESDLLVLVKKDLNEAIEICNNSRGEIREKLITALEGACYEIVDCSPTGINTVTEQGLERMVDQVVDQCISKVNTVIAKIFDVSNGDYSMNTTPTYSGTEYGANPYTDYINKDGTVTPYSLTKITGESSKPNGYPNHSVRTCCYLNEYGVSSTSQKREITLFASCDQAVLDQIKYWYFIPYIPPVAGCSNTTIPSWADTSADNPNGPNVESYPCGSEGGCSDGTGAPTQNCTSNSTTKKYSVTTKIEASINP